MQINFYHLITSPLERGLPKLLEKVHQMGLKTVVLAKDEEQVAHLNQQLWSYTTKYFLPHGAQEDGSCEKQPVFLTTKDENPAGASVLAMVGGATPASLEGFEKAIYMFDGTEDTQVKEARERWKSYKALGHEVVYWRQTQKGSWEKAA
jgi:DNA polymerase-3 subunit chi